MNVINIRVSNQRWSIDPWTHCSKTCDGGSQSRSITCVTKTLDGTILTAPNELKCFGSGKREKPSTWRKCNEQPCPYWAAQRWSMCSVTCGAGKQHRLVMCQNRDGTPAFNCDVDAKPEVTRDCLSKTSCIVIEEVPIIKIVAPVEEKSATKSAFYEPETISISTDPSWVPDPWGPCSVSCGGSGVSTREVKCKVYLEFVGSVEDLPDEQCPGDKPSDSQACFMGPCPRTWNLKHDTYRGPLLQAIGVGTEIRDFSSIVSHYEEDSDWRGDEEAELTLIETHDDDFGQEYQDTEEEEDTTSESDYENYEWIYEDFGPCIPSCGSGSKFALQICVHLETRARSSDDRCDPATKSHPMFEICNEGPCFVTSTPQASKGWEISPYGECSRTCGRGVQRRSVVCRQIPDGDLPARPQSKISLPEIMCPLPKPATERPCSLVACAPEWIPGAWSECSRSCGRGSKARDSHCVQLLATGATEPVPQQYCSRFRPESKRRCSIVSCPPRYIVKQWGECSVTCGKGIQRREAMCMRIPAGGNKVQRISSNYCTHMQLPSLSRQCKRRKCTAGGGSFNNARYARIITENRTYVQRTRTSKIRIVVGTKAHILPRTNVIMLCPVFRFKKSLIYWKFNGTEVESDGDDVILGPDGSLRIRSADRANIGRYTCVAGDAEADIILNIAQPGGDSNLSRDNRRSSSRQRHHRPNFVGPDLLDLGQRGTAIISDTSPAAGRELVRPIPTINREESRALSPRPVSIHTAHPKSKSTRHVVDRFIPRDPEEINSTENDAELPEVEIPPLLDPKQEILMLLDAAGVENSSEKAQDILSNISTDYEDHIRRVEVLSPPQELPKIPILGEEDPKSDQIGDTGISRGPNGFNSIPSMSVPGNNRNRESVQLITIREPPPIEIKETLEYMPPQISTIQPTEAPIQLDKEIVTYVGGTLIVSDPISITLLCEAQGYPRPSIEWLKDDSKFVPNLRQFVLLDDSLRIMEPSRTDGGTYTCKATNELGTDSVSTVLNVATNPRILSTMDELSDLVSDIVEVPLGSIITARLGSTVRISCPVEGFPEPYVKWNKDVSGLGENMRVLADNRLEIQPTTTADQGVYSCEASNPVGTDYQASALVLYDPPHLSEISVTPELEMNGMFGIPQVLETHLEAPVYKVKSGSSVMMACPVAGFPDPKMTWTYKGRPLHRHSQQLEYQILLHGKVLQLPDVNPATVGSFECHSSNGGGNLTTSLNLQLIEYSYSYGEYSPCSATCGGNGIKQTTIVCLEDLSKPVHDWYCNDLEKPQPKSLPCNRVNCPPRFHAGKWSSCSKTCGKGAKTRKVTCQVVLSDNSVSDVSESTCLRHASNLSREDTQQSTEFILNKPDEHKSCQIQACPMWKPGSWSPCSKKCHGRGTSLKIRRLYCVAENGTKLHRSECKHSPRPRRRELCKTSRCEPMWITSRWSDCSRSCGEDGIQTRILNCVFRGNRRQRAGAMCQRDSRPPVTAPCNRIDCQTARKKSKPSKVPCVDKSRYCTVAKSSGLCAFYKYLCCRTCR